MLITSNYFNDQLVNHSVLIISGFERKSVPINCNVLIKMTGTICNEVHRQIYRIDGVTQ